MTDTPAPGFASNPALSGASKASGTPDVSIVLIVFNDAVRLPRAIQSLREQTLRDIEIIVVDDASTDDTPRVVREAMDADSRIRYVRLAANSGGCSAPRNRGIDEARGTWVMFCDSDDRYERHAAKNLLLSVESADADLGCGVAERIDVRSGQSRRWRESLHEPAVLASILDRPDLIADTISVNKIYRRAFLLEHGLRFPEGLLYEDQLFTMQAYCQARRIAVIPQTTYLWSVDRIGDEPSITQRRKEERNARDRVAINKRIDEYLAGHGSDELRMAKARKFLSHDLYLYLSSILESDDATALALVDIWQPYVAQVDLRQAEGLRPALRVAVYHLLLRDLEGIRSAMRCIRWSAVVEVPVVLQGERQVWACEHLADGPRLAGLEPSWWLDVTAMAIAGAPVPERRLCHRATEVKVQGNRVVVTGTTSDAFAMLERSSRVRLAVATISGRIWCSVPVSLRRSPGSTSSDSRASTDSRVTGAGEGVGPGLSGTAELKTRSTAALKFNWRAEGPWQWQVDPVVESYSRGSLVLSIEVDGHLNVMPLRMLGTHVERLDLDLGHGVLVRLAPGEHGSIDWRVLRPGRGWRARRQGHGTLAGVLRVLHRRMLWLTSLIARHFPARPIVVFESSGGRAFEGHPRAMSEALAEMPAPTRQAWSYLGEAERFPGWADSIRRDTIRHRWVMGRARWWVDDSGEWQSIRKHPRNRMLQTWQGQPIASIGGDLAGGDPSARSSRWPSPSQVRRWDLMLAPSRTFADYVPQAVGFRGDLIESATPFGDAVLAAASADLDDDGDLTELLALPQRPVVMAAFTGADVPFDLDEVVAALGARSFWLLARDDGRRLSVPAACRAAARDVSAVDGRASHLAASQLLVTDGSIWTMDFARLHRPIVIWGPGYQNLRRTSGTLVDLPAYAPVVDSTSALIAAVEHWLDHGSIGQAGTASDALGRLAGSADGWGAERCILTMQTGRSHAGRLDRGLRMDTKGEHDERA